MHNYNDFLYRLRFLIQNLEEEVKTLYRWAEKRAIVDYIFMDWTERIRLRVYQIPKAFPNYIVRGPLPWHNNYLVSRETMRHNLFITHPVMLAIRRLWDDV
jgi:dynein heavy chain